MKKSWDTWVLILLNLLCLVMAAANAVGYIYSGFPSRLPIFLGWVSATSRPLMVANVIFDIAWLGVLVGGLLFSARWAWYFVLVVTALSVSSFLPIYVVAPVGAEAPTLSAFPIVLRVILGVGTACIVLFHIYWLIKHRPRRAEPPLLRHDEP